VTRSSINRVSQTDLSRALENGAIPPATPEDLATRDAVDRRFAKVEERIKSLNRALNNWREFARDAVERERITTLTAERDALIEHRTGLLERRVALDDALQTTWRRAFMRAVKEDVPDEQYRRYIARADEIHDAAQRRAACQLVGSAVEVRGSAGSPRERAS
jgi:hypothetical protein